MSAKASYFKIGVFVIVAAAIIVIGIAVLGAGAIFRRTVTVETYVSESVQGLDEGSAVSLRGVKIGTVKKITLVAKEYKTSLPYVLVRIALNPDAFPVTSEEAILEGLRGEVQKGLRVRLATLGLTGTMYIEADYLEPERFPPLAVDWTPEYPYVPSARSTYMRLTDALDGIMRNLERINVGGITDELQKTLAALTNAIEGTDLQAVSREAIALLEEVRATNRKLAAVVEQVDVKPILKDAHATMAAVRKTVLDIDRPVNDLLTSLQGVSANLSRFTARLDALAEKDVPENLTSFKATMRRLDTLVAGQQYEIKTIVENLRVMSENLRELSENAKRYPSHVLFGEPPNPSRIGK
jgi:ABC-type transporter Mla subunit MlaD